MRYISNILKKTGVALVITGLSLCASLNCFANELDNNYYDEVCSDRLINALRYESDLEDVNEYWYSPLAAHYDGMPVRVHTMITDKYIDSEGKYCLVLDRYTSKHRAGNWYREEAFSIKVILSKDEQHMYSKVKKGDFIRAYGIAEVDYRWDNIHINKRDQASLRGLANFQCNGRGRHEYAFEIRNAKIRKIIDD